MAIVSFVIKVFWLCADKSDCVRDYLYIKRWNFEGNSYLNFLLLPLSAFLSFFSSKCALIECVCISITVVMSLKDAILSSGNLLEDNSNLAGGNSEKNVCAPPLLPASNSVSLGCVNDPPSDAAFPEVVVVDEFSQVQKDIEELSKSCLLGKMLGEPLDVRTIVSRTKAE